MTGATDWAAISALYDGLVRLAPSLGASVARASAHLHAHGPAAAEIALAAVDGAAADVYQPYWVTLAEIADASGDGERADRARSRAIGLTDDPHVVEYLRRRR
jgi:RNA polymerase sigma-70 factor (ECF subfamily)